METYEQQALLNSKDELMSLAQESRASQRVLPGSDEARQMTVGYGRQLSMLLNQSNPLGVFSKILLASPHFTNSEEFCYVWQVWDTRLDCSAFRLTVLAQSTEENGSSLWPTAKATDAKQGSCKTGRSTEAQYKKAGWNIREYAAATLWPAPTRMNDTGGQALCKWGGSGARQKLRTMVSPEVLNGSLNPRFVEELMGFAIDHTALKRSETPSSRSKPTRSSKRSRKPKVPTYNGAG